MNIPEISPYYPPLASQSRPQITNPILQTPTINTNQFLPKKEVDYVSGYDGANAFPLGPNSSTLLLDKELNVLWVIATDQNGNKSVVKGYNIGEEYVPPKAVTLDDLMAQMQSMNDRLSKMEEAGKSGQSYNRSVGQSKPNGANGSASQRNGSGNAVWNANGNAEPVRSTYETCK